MTRRRAAALTLAASFALASCAAPADQGASTTPAAGTASSEENCTPEGMQTFTAGSLTVASASRSRDSRPAPVTTSSSRTTPRVSPLRHSAHPSSGTLSATDQMSLIRAAVPGRGQRHGPGLTDRDITNVQQHPPDDAVPDRTTTSVG